MKNTSAFAGFLAVVFTFPGCTVDQDDDSEKDSTKLGKEDVASQEGKADSSLIARWCLELGAPSDCDLCEINGWYDDGVCDTFCSMPDPDCEGEYDPCAGKACGDRCQLCPPGDMNCIESSVLKQCNAQGVCTHLPAECSEPTYDPCAGKACGDSCQICPPGDMNCVESSVLKQCNEQGVCSHHDPNCSGECGTTTVTFIYNGSEVTYGTVVSSGKCWLDRNLGASQVGTSGSEPTTFGDLFQWGRAADGHQIRTSETIPTLSNTDNPGHGSFIPTASWPYDWRSGQNDNLWQGVNGTNNPCPPGWRIPTEAEWNVERDSWSTNNAAGAFASPLKLPMAGLRTYNDGTISAVSEGYYWSSTALLTTSYFLNFTGTNTTITIESRAAGFSVRCIKE